MLMYNLDDTESRDKIITADEKGELGIYNIRTKTKHVMDNLTGKMVHGLLREQELCVLGKFNTAGLDVNLTLIWQMESSRNWKGTWNNWREHFLPFNARMDSELEYLGKFMKDWFTHRHCLNWTKLEIDMNGLD